jgi:hypothetical protein
MAVGFLASDRPGWATIPPRRASAHDDVSGNARINGVATAASYERENGMFSLGPRVPPSTMQAVKIKGEATGQRCSVSEIIRP